MASDTDVVAPFVDELLPTWSGEYPRCIKCEARLGALVEYTRPGYILNDCLSPYLKRTCVRCGYSWPERCADDAGEHVTGLVGFRPVKVAKR